MNRTVMQQAVNLDQSMVLERVTLTLGVRTLLNVDATINAGEVLSVMGPSGSGKSTLLAFIGGFLDPHFNAIGKVFIRGQDVTGLEPSARHAGILFQDPLLFPHMSVGGNLLFAIPAGIKDKPLRIAKAKAALQEMGLDGCFDHDPARLSGGQKARVALARTLLSEPHTLLLDEPFSRLDAALRAQMRELVFARARERMLPVVLVTHDPEDAEAAGGQLIKIG
ncbi:MAG: ATP-binding cassette domain-containing protein [Rhizobiaceae bacterium]